VNAETTTNSEAALNSPVSREVAPDASTSITKSFVLEDTRNLYACPELDARTATSQQQ